MEQSKDDNGVKERLPIGENVTIVDQFQWTIAGNNIMQFVAIMFKIGEHEYLFPFPLEEAETVAQDIIDRVKEAREITVN